MTILRDVPAVRRKQIQQSFFLYSLRLSIAGILLSIPVPTLASDYYVDNAVPSSGTGSIDSPFKSIQEGINKLAPGDTLWIRGNAVGQVYPEGFSLLASGTPSQRITFIAYPHEQVSLRGASGPRVNINKDYWLFNGLVIDQANIPSDAVNIIASHLIINNLETRNGQREGISIEKASSITIEDSYIHDFMAVTSTGARTDAHCIMIDTSQSSTITDIKINRNRIERCSGDGIQIFGVTGQPVSSYAKNIQTARMPRGGADATNYRQE